MAKRDNDGDSDKPTNGSPGDDTIGQPPTPPELTWYQAIQANDEAALKKALAKEIDQIIEKRKLSNYAVLLLFDELDNITSFHSDQLYAAASSAKATNKDILLIVQSNGGRIEPAYLLSKALKRLAAKRFVVAVPRRAKSAATLIALGADEIHMGLMSQLGPIDPQLSGLPVLALGNALDVIAELACRFPAASEMFTKYLVDQVPIRMLGYHQRVGESAAQYAERLLEGKLPSEKGAESIAKHLVQHYKDHDFVIDSDEAQKLLGSRLIRQDTPEYKAADSVYQLLHWAGLFLDMKGKEFWYVGNIEDGLSVRAKRDLKINA